MHVDTLERIQDEAWLAIRGAEDWAKGYHKTPKQLAKLIRTENRMQRNLRRYFRQLPPRAYTFVDWHEYRQRAIQAGDVVPSLKDAVWQGESQILFKVLFNDIAYMIAAGAEAGQVLYEIPAGITLADVLVQKAAHTLTDKLVNTINDYTRQKVEDAITSSLKFGDDMQAATDRLDSAVGGEFGRIRAERIARTESVRSFNAGIDEYGKATGATSKTWQTVDDPCKVCESALALNDGGTVDIDQDFQTLAGAIPYPPAHPNCRCGKRLNYAVDEVVDNADMDLNIDL